MKIEKVVLRNEWRGIRSLSLRQFVSTFTPKPQWLTWATMCMYRIQTFNFFKTGTISIILNAFENWKFKQSLTKMIARWMTWQDFLLKRKLYFYLNVLFDRQKMLTVSGAFWGFLLMKKLVLLSNKSFYGLCYPRKTFLSTISFAWYKFSYSIVDYTFEGTPSTDLEGWSFRSSSHLSLAKALKAVQSALRYRGMTLGTCFKIRVASAYFRDLLPFVLI